MRALVVVLSLLLPAVAGCVTPPEETTPAAAPVDDLARILVPPGPEGEAVWSWTTTEPLGDTVVAVNFSLPAETECTFSGGIANERHEPGASGMFLLLRDGAPAGWGSAASGPLGRVVAGPIDTYELTGEGGRGATGWSSGGSVKAGNLTVIAAGYGIQAWENDITGPNSMQLSISCADGFEVNGFAASHDVLLFDASSLRGAAGATAPLLAATAGATASLDVAASQSFGFVAGYNAIGRVELRAPSAHGEVTFIPEAYASLFLHDGPGTWSVEAPTVVEGGFLFPRVSLFVGAILGLEPVASLDDVA